MENQILPQVQEERSKKLIELSNRNQEKYNKQKELSKKSSFFITLKI